MSDFGVSVLVPLAGIFCLFGLPVLAFIFFRMLAHRERMEMIRSGIAPGGAAAPQWRAAPASATVRAPIPQQDPAAAETAQCTLRKGITLSFIGFAVTLGLSFIGFHDDGWRPGPWLLGGLVPMFVGIAQVIIGLLSGATLGPPRYDADRQNYYAGTMPPPPPGPAPNFDSSYTYRPGSTQELRPPTAPPERRS